MNCLKTRLFLGMTLGMIVGSTTSAAEPLRTNGASFRIPFAVDQSNSGGSATAILFSSKDGGAMEPVQRVAARERSFHFLASGDGKFQFAVRMMDAQGKMIGEDGPLVPELEVIVDSKPPAIYLELAEIASGEAVLKWSFSEQEIATETLKIEYLESSTGVWKPVTAGAVQSLTSAKQATIQSNPGQSIAVRASVKDKAGNVGSGTGQIVLSRQPSRQAGTGHPVGHTAAQGRNGSQDSATRSFLPFGANASAATGSGALSIPSGQSPTILGTSPFSLSDETPQTAAKTSPNQASDFGQTDSTQISMQTVRSSNSGMLSIPAPQPNSASVMAVSNPAEGFQSFATGTDQPSATGFTSQSHSDYGYRGLEQQHLNNRLFDLAYEIDSVGPSGVGLVVLYVTEDNGRNWFRYGEDKDLKSPFKVDTRGEGTFGFAVRVHNGVGFSDPPPQPGEVPSVVVSVDQTPPALRLATPELATQGQGTIRLRWDVQEANPADEAVRLEYATAPEGPWSPVFDWQENPGGFEMPVDRSLPPALHFRLLARDQAGNVSTTQTAQPVLIDRKRPKARVLSVKPASANRGY
ncbi:MAG: hypothetical protein ABJZ55_21370 [Fuerstiella sp.]